MFKHFSYDIDQETKKEYLKNYPIIKKDDHGLLMRRTYLYVLKQRKEVDGHEECAGYSCECGYSYVLEELLGWSLVGSIIYGVYRLFKKHR
ncbi:MAG TPA: hypothetical protein DCW90_08770 [Lachnospiraceae bacterium]|nr:hypothetical protein [Lachnospiraceae bacterium]